PFFCAARHLVPVAHTEQQGALRTVGVFVQFAPRMNDEAPWSDLDSFGRGPHPASALEAKVDLGRVGVAVIGARLTRLPTGNRDVAFADPAEHPCVSWGRTPARPSD